MTAEDDVIFKFLHTADWHLGKRFERFGQYEASLTRARLEVLDRVFGIAERYAVDAVLCAGDLFDDPFPKREWWEGVAKKLRNRRWDNRPVFLLPGNHDPLMPESIWENFEFRNALPPGFTSSERHPRMRAAVMHSRTNKISAPSSCATM
jgi:exonuclease SbcD